MARPPAAAAAPSGRPDPTSGATGTNVFGINLSGDYSTARRRALLSDHGRDQPGRTITGTQLRFKRWLNTDYPPWVYETIQVSNDGVELDQYLHQLTPARISDSAWTTVQYDISAVADKKSTVYIRWGHQVGSGGRLCLFRLEYR